MDAGAESKRVRFLFDGRPVEAREGDSIAAALTAAGEVAVRHARSGASRGVFCGMGVCSDCLVTVDGERSRRACMTSVSEGLEVESQGDLDGPSPHPESDTGAVETIDCDLAIVGAGPAGLSAASLAATAGLSVLMLDERGEPGGQYFKPRSRGARHRFAPDAQHRQGLTLTAEAGKAGAQFRNGETVWYARRNDDAPGFRLASTSARGALRVDAKALLLAAGAYEKPAIVLGWTLPGVMTIGAAQTFVRRYGVAPGKRLLIAGNGPLGLQLAAELRRLGSAPVVVAERSGLTAATSLAQMAVRDPRLVLQGLWYRMGLLLGGIPFLPGWEIASVAGEGRVEAAVLRNVSTGVERRLDVDSVAAGDGFTPQAELARLLGCAESIDAGGYPVPIRDDGGRTAVEGLFIAGDGGGLGGAHAAMAQGRIAAAAVVRSFGKTTETAGAIRDLARARRFQSALWSYFAAPARPTPHDATLVCRCEEVSAGAVRVTISEGASDAGAVKRTTRLGMGRCQGRYCVPVLLRMLGEAGHAPAPERLFAPQLPARPLRAAAILREKPEWGGHRESRPGARPAALRTHPLAVTRADVVVVGAGITGICAGLEAAARGAKVVCVERGRVGAEASGGNAGSLHLQLLSWDFGGKAIEGGGPQLQTLPLQRDSIALWHDLHAKAGRTFELSITGGMMVAEDEAQRVFLEKKVAAEASVGIQSEVIGADRIRRLIPAISERMVAAAWCSGEGKIDPLGANAAVVAMARRAGVIFEENATAMAIARTVGGYSVETPLGSVDAGRVIIACGGWTAMLGHLLGVNLPVRGAPLQMIATEAAPPLVPCLLAHADRHLTMKQTGAGTLLIGGAWTAETGPDGQARILSDSLEGNLWVAARAVPAVAGLHVTRTWAAMNIDLDGAPLLSPVPGWPGIVVAATANGYTLGPLIGREAAAMALSGIVPRALAQFTLDRFNTSTRKIHA